ncbi:MAG: 1,4-alpha-glucan branching protein GlgB [Burkholderiales bacterium]|nr:1,4-alpha-glucan branching protein GlgB [Burkholderiales bacterium]
MNSRSTLHGDPLVEQLLAARLHDPFALLGAHSHGRGWRLRVFDPRAEEMWLRLPAGLVPLVRIHADGLFEWTGEQAPPRHHRLAVSAGGLVHERHDPYAFAPVLSGHDLYLLNEGTLREAWRALGSHVQTREGAVGTRFAVWAPNAERVSVIGEFNAWDGRVHPMAAHGGSGVWELFVPGVGGGELYRYEIRNRDSGEVMAKIDPFAREFERRPGTASRVSRPGAYAWQDQAWMARRRQWDWQHAPVNIYELHAGSWKRHPDGRMYGYRELAAHLVPYLLDMGFTHVELLPVSEHPLDESWGYQTTGYFAATSRFGTPDELRALIDALHGAGIGVFLDWVPGHFPQDRWALARFDGTALYEHEDPRLGLHQDWGTHVFNYGRNEVRGFLLSSAHFWLSEFHIDGLRVDAVASMLYLDYSREAGEWLPNRHGGRENLEAIEFLRELNVMVHEEFPGAVTMAEESTAWPMVSRPVYLGGLGFSMKWNMGWMNDTLRYMRHDPVHRRFHHDLLTFGQLYAYTENFLLPLSHDEVVHGKGSLLDKMPGDTWQEFANLRLLFVFQFTTPGKKLNFMGNEFAQGREWKAGGELDWWLLQRDWHAGVQRLVRDLSRLYRDVPALHQLDFSGEGFAWIDCHDADHSIVSFQRRARDGSHVVVVLNFTPVAHQGYRIGLPFAGRYAETLNSDSSFYAGSNLGNVGGVRTEPLPWMGQPQSAAITLPPLAGIVLTPESA